MLPRSLLENLEPRRLFNGNPAINISDVALVEGQAGATAYVFTVSLSKASSKRVSVDFATENASAQAGTDYVQNSGTLHFSRGQTSKTITVLVNGDTTVESDETFTVKLRHAGNASIADSRGIGTIVNDDVLLPPPVQPPVEPPPDDTPIYTDPTYYDPGYYYDPGWFNPPGEGGAYW